MTNEPTIIASISKRSGIIFAVSMPIVFALIIIYCFFGSVGNAITWLGGERVWLSPSEIDLGKVESGTHTVAVQLTSFHNQPLQIVGGRGACKCISMPSLPMEFAPHEQVKLDLTVTIEDDPSPNSEIVRQSFVLFTNVPGNERLEGVVCWHR